MFRSFHQSGNTTFVMIIAEMLEVFHVTADSGYFRS